MAKNIEGTEASPSDILRLIALSGKEIEFEPFRDLISNAKWRRSSRGITASTNPFVEVTFIGTPGEQDQLILVREGRTPKDKRPPSDILVFTPQEWDAFILGAQDGEFDIAERKKRNLHKNPHLRRSTGWRPRPKRSRVVAKV
jgi:hypothetical protein